LTNSFAAVRPHHSVVTLAKMTLAMPLQVARQPSTAAVDHIELQRQYRLPKFSRPEVHLRLSMAGNGTSTHN